MMDHDNTPSPPPPQPPPVPPYRVPVRPRKPGSGWKVAVLVLAVLLCLSGLLNLTSFLESLLMSGGGGHGGKRHNFEEVLIEDNDAFDKIVVVSVKGMITDQPLGSSPRGMSTHIRDQLDVAARDDAVRAIILKVDSPGGEVLASDEIYKAIEEFQGNNGIPVIAAMGGLAASGGYYVSAPCRWIVANELTITGSIGVIMQTFNYRGLLDKVGLRTETFKSGKFKDMLGGTKKEEEITAEERAMVQNMVNETFNRFKEVVREGRNAAAEFNRDRDDKGKALADDWADYADGRILSGKDAYELGFVDELGNFKVAVNRALKLGGVSSANVVEYRPIFDLSSFFRLFGKANTETTVKLDVGMEPPNLRAGYLYFLSPTLIQ